MSMVAVAFFYGIFTTMLGSCSALIVATLAYVATLILAIAHTQQIASDLAIPIAGQIFAFNAGLLVSIVVPAFLQSKQKSI